MKKVLFLLMMMVCCLGIKAQTAIETPKTFDNWYVGAQVGVTTPTSFNSVFPLNTYAGLKIGKNLTPVIGFNAESNVWFGSATYDQGRFSYRNGVRGINTGINMTIDIFNWFGRYNPDRVFTIQPEVGLGWLHTFNSNSNDIDDMTAKTGIQFAWNVGKARAWQLYVEPTMWWNLTASHGVVFNKNHSQLGIQVGFIYKFKNSNGTHNFAVYDIAAMNAQINNLHEQVDSLNKVKPDTIRVTERVKEVSYAAPFYVLFAQNSDVLTNEAKSVLDSIDSNLTVKVTATASPEGRKNYNFTLSERRAANVAKYLINRGVTVISSEGIGVTGDASNRVAIITVNQ